MAKILLAQNDKTERDGLSGPLSRDGHDVIPVADGGAVTARAERERPDLILLDAMMSEMDGYEICRRLRADPATAAIPVIFLAVSADEEAESFAAGGTDCIRKPFNPAVIEARLRAHLARKNQDAILEDRVRERTRELSALQEATILAVTALAETRDFDSGNHIRRTQFYVKALAERLRHHPDFAAQLDDDRIDMLFKSAPLHDIGKAGIPDHILLKPGHLEPQEFEIMKTHSALGSAAIEQAERALGTPVEFLATAKQIARSHHERWDGNGYPDNLAGDAIPLAARLMAVADVYDALVSRRAYKEGMPHDRAAAIIVGARGSHFDPDIVDAFVALEDEFLEISTRYADIDRDPVEKRDRTVH